MNENEDEKIRRIWRELEKYPTKELELAPYEFRPKRNFKPIFTSG